MKTLFLLIVLTQNGAGDINASFVNTDTLEQCQQKALMLEGVFTGSGIPLLESRCVLSERVFSEFDHAPAASKIRYFYLVGLNHEVQIRQMPDWQTCRLQAKQTVVSGRLYCSSSVQFMQQ